MAIAGLFLTIDDSMTSSWCPAGRSPSSSIKEVVNGPLLLVAGIAIMAWPVYKIVKGWTKESKN